LRHELLLKQFELELKVPTCVLVGSEQLKNFATERLQAADLHLIPRRRLGLSVNLTAHVAVRGVGPIGRDSL
jgi:hypothetical protein